MEHQYHITKISGNKKTGPIATTTTSRSTCPSSCIFRGKGRECYAEGYPLNTHWNRVDRRERGGNLQWFLKELKALPYGTMVRGQQAGDMPGNGVDKLDHDKCVAIAEAMTTKRKTAWTYCAYLLSKNLETWRAVLSKGFAMNSSCYSLDIVDYAMDAGIPATMVWKSDFKGRNQTTPKGRKVVGCPAQLSDDITCSNCGGSKGPLCARIDRDFAVGFYAHGVAKKRVDARLDKYRGGSDE